MRRLCPAGGSVPPSQQGVDGAARFRMAWGHMALTARGTDHWGRSCIPQGNEGTDCLGRPLTATLGADDGVKGACRGGPSVGAGRGGLGFRVQFDCPLPHLGDAAQSLAILFQVTRT